MCAATAYTCHTRCRGISYNALKMRRDFGVMKMRMRVKHGTGPFAPCPERLRLTDTRRCLNVLDALETLSVGQVLLAEPAAEIADGVISLAPHPVGQAC